MRPKPVTPRDPDYLAWLRKMPCAFCGDLPPSEVSHHGPHGVGVKASDLDALPACRNCHWRWHNTGSPRHDWEHLSREEKRDRFRELAVAYRIWHRWRHETLETDEPAESPLSNQTSKQDEKLWKTVESTVKSELNDSGGLDPNSENVTRGSRSKGEPSDPGFGEHAPRVPDHLSRWWKYGEIARCARVVREYPHNLRGKRVTDRRNPYDSETDDDLF